MKKILIVLTNEEKYEAVSRPTGLWFSELTHFLDVMIEENFEVDFVSPKGGYVPIYPNSLMNLDEIDWKWYTDEVFRNRALSNTLKPSEVNAEDYVAIYYAGGHGAMFDFPDAKELSAIASKIYKNQGIVSAVCHGIVGLLNIVDEQGKELVADRIITGFTNEEEEIGQATAIVPFLAEDELKKHGANYQSGAAYTDVVKVDGRLLTGQNPQSAHSLGQAVAKKLKK